MTRPGIQAYYAARATEYERVYAKPERQSDLGRLHSYVPEQLVGGRVLDVACCTGYWTRRIAARATTITGCDVTPEVLAAAGAQQSPSTPANFIIGDSFRLDEIPGAFDAAFGFWWSHMLRADLPRFLRGLHPRVGRGRRVVIVDSRYVAGSNLPITPTDIDGNTYQRGLLADGTEYEVHALRRDGRVEDEGGDGRRPHSHWC